MCIYGGRWEAQHLDMVHFTGMNVWIFTNKKNKGNMRLSDQVVVDITSSHLRQGKKLWGSVCTIHT